MSSLSRILVIPFLLSTAVTIHCMAQQNLAEKLGFEKDAILLIVHADDIGVSQSVNAATIEAFEQGGITSGSIMIPCPWANDFATYYREHPDLDVGIHITLTSEWQNYKWGGVLPSTEIPSLLDSMNYFYSTEEEVAMHTDVLEVEKEVRAQIERALILGIQPTHLDTHMGTMGVKPELIELYLKLGKVYGLPVMIPREWIHFMPDEVKSSVASEYILVDGFYEMYHEPEGMSWEEAYGSMIETMQPGLNQMIVHLAHDNAEMRAVTINHPDYGAVWRQNDLDFVTGDAFRKMIRERQIHLITWKDIKSVM